MGDPTETVSSSETVDLDRVRSRINELRDIHGSPNDIPELPPSDSKKFLKDSALQLESKINEVLSEFSDIGSLAVEDLDAYVGHMKEELNSVEAANAKISKEIEDLTRTYIGDSSQLESELEGLSTLLRSCFLNSIFRVPFDIESRNIAMLIIQTIGHCRIARQSTIACLCIVAYPHGCQHVNWLIAFISDTVNEKYL